jgi:hypothetical protein
MIVTQPESICMRVNLTGCDQDSRNKFYPFSVVNYDRESDAENEAERYGLGCACSTQMRITRRRADSTRRT